jgi:hypothetical protein
LRGRMWPRGGGRYSPARGTRPGAFAARVRGRKRAARRGTAAYATAPPGLISGRYRRLTRGSAAVPRRRTGAGMSCSSGGAGSRGEPVRGGEGVAGHPAGTYQRGGSHLDLPRKGSTPRRRPPLPPATASSRAQRVGYAGDAASASARRPRSASMRRRSEPVTLRHACPQCRASRRRWSIGALQARQVRGAEGVIRVSFRPPSGTGAAREFAASGSHIVIRPGLRICPTFSGCARMVRRRARGSAAGA